MAIIVVPQFKSHDIITVVDVAWDRHGWSEAGVVLGVVL